MSKKLKYDQPLAMSEQELKDSGEAIAFFRVVLFETGVCSDGKFSAQQMIAALCMLMIEKPEIRKALKGATKLYKRVEGNPFALKALASILTERAKDGEDCNCPACQMLREIERQQNEN